MTISRRTFQLAALGALLAAPSLVRASAPAPAAASPDHDMSMFPPSWHGSETIAFLAYPGFTLLDLVGPHYMLGNLMGAKVHIVAKTLDPVESDMKLALVPTATFDTCPQTLDILSVPGGTMGTLAAMADPATRGFVKSRGETAKWVTSVCTGSLVLGAAGLLEGYRATSHWAARELLSDLGATPVDERVVIDRNRITGAGVTAGLDFGLTLVGMLRDRQYAESVQLLAEYAPEPPFDAGTSKTAPPEVHAMMDEMLKGFRVEAREIIKTL